MKWFGEWTAPITQMAEKTDVPSTPCGYCHQPFAPDDFGVVMPFLGGPMDPPEIGYHHHCLGAALGIDPAS